MPRRWCEAVDETDLAILRELTRDRVFFWASLDPRVCAERVARRLRKSPTTIRKRIAAWAERGFLVRTEVIPHPALLGWRLGAGSIRVDDPRAKAAVIEQVGLVPGALAVLDHVGPWLALNLVGEGEAGFERVRRLIGKFPGVAEVTPCHALAPPAPPRPATPLEWRVLRALRAAPDRSLHAAAAAAVGVTPKTFSRKYRGLLESSAVLFVPVLDFSRCGGGTVVRLIVTPHAGADRASLLAALRRLPRLMDVFDGQALLGRPDARVDLWMHLPSLAEVEAVAASVLAHPGVEEVEHAIPVRQSFSTAWLDEAIEARAAPGPATG